MQYLWDSTFYQHRDDLMVIKCSSAYFLTKMCNLFSLAACGGFLQGCASLFCWLSSAPPIKHKHHIWFQISSCSMSWFFFFSLKHQPKVSSSKGLIKIYSTNITINTLKHFRLLADKELKHGSHSVYFNSCGCLHMAVTGEREQKQFRERGVTLFV